MDRFQLNHDGRKSQLKLGWALRCDRSSGLTVPLIGQVAVKLVNKYFETICIRLQDLSFCADNGQTRAFHTSGFTRRNRYNAD